MINLQAQKGLTVIKANKPETPQKNKNKNSEEGHFGTASSRRILDE